MNVQPNPEVLSSDTASPWCTASPSIFGAAAVSRPKCFVRVNEAHGVSERFRAALEASAPRRRGLKSEERAGAGGEPGVGSWGSIWNALIRVHGPLMFKVSPISQGQGVSEPTCLP